MILTIAAREIRSMFLSPLAWAIIGVVQLVLSGFFSYFFSQYILYYQPRLHMSTSPLGITDFVVTPLYFWIGVVLMFTIPLITMRVISEEKRNGTITLLFSAPLSMTEIVIGKYLGLVGFLGIMTLVYTLMPLSLLFATGLNWGLFFSSLLGTFLMICASASIGLFMSSLTKQPVIAAITTFGAILLFTLLYLFGNSTQEEATRLTQYLSILGHWQAFEQGIFSTSNFVYFVLFIFTFLTLTIRRLDADRLQH